MEEPSYFFKLSEYQGKLIAHIKANPEAAGAFFGLMAESKASGDAESIAGAQAMADANSGLLELPDEFANLVL